MKPFDISLSEIEDRIFKSKKPHKHSIAFVLIINVVIPILINILQYPLWVAWEINDNNYLYLLLIPLLPLWLNIVAVPTILTMTNYTFCLKTKKTNVVLFSVLIVISNIISVGMGYLNWGITTGLLSKPDIGTLGLTKTEFVLAMTMSYVCGYIAYKRFSCIKMKNKVLG